MAKSKSGTNAEILRYALAHLEQERDQIQAKIDHIHAELGGKVSAPAVAADAAEETPRKKRKLNASARKRIAAAQKKRWAEFHKAKAKAAKAE